MSLSYANTPVYIGVPNTDSVNTGFTGSIDYVPAIRSDVTFQSSAQPKRNLGVDVEVTDQFTFDGSLAANINVESLLQEDISEGFRYLSGTTDIQKAYVPVQIGENLYKKCYPTDVSISVQPFVPATIRASFVSLDPPSNAEKISGDSRVLAETKEFPISGDSIVYGHTCSVTNMNELVRNVQTQINFTRRYNRSPVYGIGSEFASSMLLDGIEEEMSVSSTGLAKFINISGQELTDGSFGVTLQAADSSFNIPALADIMEFPIGATVVGQSYGVVGGETVQTSIRLRNISL